MSLGPGPIVILGAGVIGLTTAIRILESPVSKGREVHILAGHLPSDDLDANYPSGIAGAHHLSFADDKDTRQRRWDLASESFRHSSSLWPSLPCSQQRVEGKGGEHRTYDGDTK